MPDDELMAIGAFAHVSGGSVHQLRHDDEVGCWFRPRWTRPAGPTGPGTALGRRADRDDRARVLDADAAGASGEVRRLLEEHADDLRRDRLRLDGRPRPGPPPCARGRRDREGRTALREGMPRGSGLRDPFGTPVGQAQDWPALVVTARHA